MIYFDNAASTSVRKDVLAEMLPFLSSQFANADSPHVAAAGSRNAIEKARENVTKLIKGSKPEQIIFTSGGTEANNLAILGLEKTLSESGKKDVLSSATEHESVLKSVEELTKRLDSTLTLVHPRQKGYVSFDTVRPHITSSTGLVSVMFVNNETGAVNDVEKICEYCERIGVLTHVDCVQAAGFTEIDVCKLKADFISISSHKIHGPKGVGCLYARRPELLNPIRFGGQQEHGLLPGTQNTACIVGFGKAAEIAVMEIRGNVQKVSQRYGEMVKELSGVPGVHFNIPADGMVQKKILSVRFEGVDADTLLLCLDAKGVCASAGAACQSNAVEPSHVLIASGLSRLEASQTIRLSFSDDNTASDVVRGAFAIRHSVNFLRSGKSVDSE